MSEQFRVGARVRLQDGSLGTIVKGPYDPTQWAVELDNEPTIDGYPARRLTYSSEMKLVQA